MRGIVLLYAYTAALLLWGAVVGALLGLLQWILTTQILSGWQRITVYLVYCWLLEVLFREH